jgi:hypothetical protein
MAEELREALEGSVQPNEEEVGEVLQELEGLTAPTRRSLTADNTAQVEMTVRAARERSIQALQTRVDDLVDGGDLTNEVGAVDLADAVSAAVAAQRINLQQAILSVGTAVELAEGEQWYANLASALEAGVHATIDAASAERRRMEEARVREHRELECRVQAAEDDAYSKALAHGKAAVEELVAAVEEDDGRVPMGEDAAKSRAALVARNASLVLRESLQGGAGGGGGGGGADGGGTGDRDGMGGGRGYHSDREHSLVPPERVDEAAARLEAQLTMEFFAPFFKANAAKIAAAQGVLVEACINRARASLNELGAAAGGGPSTSSSSPSSPSSKTSFLSMHPVNPQAVSRRRASLEDQMCGDLRHSLCAYMGTTQVDEAVKRLKARLEVDCFLPFLASNKAKTDGLKTTTLASVVTSFSPMVEARVGGSLPVSSLAMEGALEAVNRDMTFELEKCLGGIIPPQEVREKERKNR